MAGGWGDRMIRLVDWFWPFPLGIFAFTLALVVTTGIWLAVRSPRPAGAGRPAGLAGSTALPGQAPSSLPPAPPTATPAESGDPFPGANLSSRRVAIPERIGASAPSSPARNVPPPEKGTATAALTKPPAQQRETQKTPVAPRISAAQKAAVADRVTIGRFLMDRKEYPAAIKEFQAALAIDPASREAQDAIRQARAAATN